MSQGDSENEYDDGTQEDASLDDLMFNLARKCLEMEQRPSSLEVADMTIKLVLKLIETSDWSKSGDLISNMKEFLLREKHEFYNYYDVVLCAFKRIMQIIREECRRIVKVDNCADLPRSLLELLMPAKSETILELTREQIEDDIMDGVNELAVELETCTESIVAHFQSSIQEGDCIITHQHSSTVLQILRKAAKEKKIKVIVVDEAIDEGGLAMNMSTSLSKSGIPTLLVPYENVAGFMSTANKMVFSAKTLMSNGSVRAASGVSNMARLASAYKIPVYAVGGLHKLSTMNVPFNRSLDAALSRQRPRMLIPQRQSILGSHFILHHQFSIVDSDFITKVITNLGTADPKRLYTLTDEQFCPEDRDYGLLDPVEIEST